MVLLLLAPRLPPRLEDRGFISYVAIVIKKSKIRCMVLRLLIDQLSFICKTCYFEFA